MDESYAKVFRSMYTGSMYGAGMHIFAVWGWILAHADEQGFVEINPAVVADQLDHSGATVAQQVRDAVAFLMQPDPDSRSKDEQGRRIVHVDAFVYQVVNRPKYRDKGGDRAAYWREYRARQKAKQEDRESKTPSPRFTPPTPDEAAAYAKEIGFDLDGQHFCDHYAANGWMRGKTPIKDWKACVRTWQQRRQEDAKPETVKPAERGADGLTPLQRYQQGKSE